MAQLRLHLAQMRLQMQQMIGGVKVSPLLHCLPSGLGQGHQIPPLGSGFGQGQIPIKRGQVLQQQQRLFASIHQGTGLPQHLLRIPTGDGICQGQQLPLWHGSHQIPDGFYFNRPVQ